MILQAGIKLKLEYKGEFLDCLKHDLDKYDKVFLVDDNNLDESKFLHGELTNKNSAIEFLTEFCNFINEHVQKKILILSVLDYEFVLPNSSLYRKITREEFCYLYQLYCTYEFSDRFFIIYQTGKIGRLFDFIDTGLLDFKEVLAALLY